MHPKYGRIGGALMLVCCVVLLIAGPLVWKIVAGLFLASLVGSRLPLVDRAAKGVTVA